LVKRSWSSLKRCHPTQLTALGLQIPIQEKSAYLQEPSSLLMVAHSCSLYPVAPYKPKENPIVPIAKNQYRVPAELSVHPASQQPRFTKMNPKLIISNLIPGEASKLMHTEEFQDSLAKFYGVDESISRNPSRKALAEYGHRVLQANGRKRGAIIKG
jgi:hypothetical protein